WTNFFQSLEDNTLESIEYGMEPIQDECLSKKTVSILQQTGAIVEESDPNRVAFFIINRFGYYYWNIMLVFR
ncbi:hypothetical protein, partial [Oceanobacillus sp. CAU 1775]